MNRLARSSVEQQMMNGAHAAADVEQRRAACAIGQEVGWSVSLGQVTLRSLVSEEVVMGLRRKDAVADAASYTVRCGGLDAIRAGFESGLVVLIATLAACGGYAAVAVATPATRVLSFGAPPAANSVA